MNNPLSYTDPSGFFFKKIKKFFKKHWKTIVTIALVAVVGFFTFGAVLGALAGLAKSGLAGAIAAGSIAGAVAGAASGFVGGFTGTLLHGGGMGSAFKVGLKGAAAGAATGAATGAIGGYFGDTAGSLHELARATSHGVAQGGFAEVQGGDFGSSFLAGFSGSIAGSAMGGTKFGQKHFGKSGSGWDGGKIVARTAAAAAVGGTVSEIGGGKFANGAATAAMVHLFNAEGGNLKNQVEHQSKPGFLKRTWNKIKEFGGSVKRALDFDKINDLTDIAFATDEPGEFGYNPMAHEDAARAYGKYVGNRFVAGSARTLSEFLYQFPKYTVKDIWSRITTGRPGPYQPYLWSDENGGILDSVDDIMNTIEGAGRVNP